MNIGKFICQKRKDKNLTQKKLAILLGISTNYLSLIENNKKNLSKKLMLNLIKNLDFNDKEKKILEKFYENLKSHNKRQNLTKKEKELEERELLIINTYDYIREHHNPISKKAKVNRLLIDYFSRTEEIITELEFIINESNNELLEYIQPIIKTTLKKIYEKAEYLKKISRSPVETNINDHKKYIINGGNNMNNTFTKLLNLIPKKELLKNLDENEIRTLILSYIASNLKLHWKDYNVEGCATGFSLRLWEGGRGKDKNKKNYMENKVVQNIDFNIDGVDNEFEYDKIVQGLSKNIVENAMIVVEDALKAARNAKTKKVRDKYLNSMNNKTFLLAALQISVILYATELLNRGININHEYLTVRLKGMKERRKELSNAWSRFYNSDQTEEDYKLAIKETNEILDYFQETTITNAQLDNIVHEKVTLEIIGEDLTENYIYKLMDDMVQKIQGKIRLISPIDL